MLGALGFALMLGAFGPTLDAGPYPEPAQAFTDDELRGPVARLEAEARQRCATEAGQNAGWILTGDGQIRCTDKHGRLHRTARTPNATTSTAKATP